MTMKRENAREVDSVGFERLSISIVEVLYYLLSCPAITFY